MLSDSELADLQSALEVVLRLAWMRLEERGVLATGRPATLDELLRRPVALAGGDGLPEREELARSGPLARLAATYDLSAAELVTVVAALAPELDGRFDAVYDALADDTGGGLTGEALRVLLARTMPGRVAAGALLAVSGKLRACGLLRLDGGPGPRHERVRLEPELAAWLAGCPPDEPALSAEFPASRLRTVRRLDDLVVPGDVRDKLGAVIDRIRSRDVVLGSWGFGGHHDHAAGFHVLLHGPPGTGKTLAAAVLGAETGLAVYRVDLASIVSKYIGETEKGLARVFDRAENGGWILFFDEADALFGRRGEVSDSRDRYANQQVSYLLQRMDTFTGVSVLATNLLRNVDVAFLRRIHAHVAFPLPDAEAREALWRSALPPQVPVAGDLDLPALAEAFALTGAEIRNAAFHAAHRAAADGGVVLGAHLREGVRAEYEKTGRMFPVGAA